MKEQIYENEYITFQFHNGVLHGKYKTPTITLDIAKSATDFRREITRGKKIPAIADISSVKHVDKATRTFFSSSEAGGDLTALAVILNNPVTRMMGNFFVKFYRPEYPFKFFTNLTEATEWIEEFAD
ncbi:MAG: hypothetical protein AAGE93_02890 [Bacteroidota bacterium]